MGGRELGIMVGGWILGESNNLDVYIVIWILF